MPPRPVVVNTVVTNTVIRTYTNFTWYSNPDKHDCPRFYQDDGNFPCDLNNKYTHVHKRLYYD